MSLGTCHGSHERDQGNEQGFFTVHYPECTIYTLRRDPHHTLHGIRVIMFHRGGIGRRKPGDRPVLMQDKEEDQPAQK